MMNGSPQQKREVEVEGGGGGNGMRAWPVGCYVWWVW
jgi:hypothetical protein